MNNPMIFNGMLNNPNNVDALYNQYKQLQQLFNSQQNFQTPMANSNASMGQRGSWIQVRDYKDVENYPVPTDGTPTLFFDYDKGVFYSKKFVNGQCCIQDFYFYSTSGGASTSAKEEPEPELNLNLEADDGNSIMTTLLDKLNEISDKLGKLVPAPTPAEPSTSVAKGK